MNNALFGKRKENARNHKDIKIETTNGKRSKLVSELNYHTEKHFSENLLAIEVKKTKAEKNKPMYLGMPILDTSKTRMNVGMIILSQSMEAKQNYVIRILIALLFILKLKIFTKILQMLLKDGLIHLTIMRMMKDHFQ